MIGIGMLSHTGNNVAMDSYGPISDNANGIGEMAWHDLDDEETQRRARSWPTWTRWATPPRPSPRESPSPRRSSPRFPFSPPSSPMSGSSRPSWAAEDHGAIRVSDTKVFIGFLLGGALPWLFSSLSIRAVSRAAAQIVEEVRPQFRIPGLMEGKVKPDYARVVGISTRSAQKELIPLATISIVMPLLVGLILQVEALGGFLAGVILSGQLLAVFMSNAGGAWDNAKKSIEDEPRDLKANTGKGSERHKASVVGDTVGDPLKDTAGPALNPMIKVVNMVSLLAAPIMVQYQNLGAIGWVVVGILAVALIWGVWKSKKPAPEIG